MASIFPPIVSAVASVLGGVSGIPTVSIRKTDVMKSRDTPPLCIVSYGPEGDEGWATTGNGSTDLGTIGTGYVVWITVYRTSVGDIADSSTNPDLVTAIRNALNKAGLTGVSAVWNTELRVHEEWEAGDFGKATERTKLSLSFQAAELRI